MKRKSESYPDVPTPEKNLLKPIYEIFLKYLKI